MSRIKKLKPKPHVVVVDTSVLWCEDKTEVVRPAFDSFWEDYSRDFQLALRVPEVVQGELAFQQAISATKSMRIATEAIEKISKITDWKYAHRIRERDIKERVAARFRTWLKRKGGKVVSTPVDKIDWTNMIHRAIWREPPFELDRNKPDYEKGFRDALILETVVHICEKESSQAKMAFLCGDNLLKDTAKAILQSDERFSCFDSLEDFESYLKLTKEKLEDQFIKSILKRASQKFYAKGGPNCLYLREGIRTRLQRDYKEYFDNPEKSDQSYLKSYLVSLRTETWEPVGAGTFWILNPRFQRIQSGNEYHWLTIVTFVRQYRRADSLSLLASLAADMDRVLFLPFHIAWKAKVSTDARFSSLSLTAIELKGNSFQVVSGEDRKAWGLRSVESLRPVFRAKLETSPSGSESDSGADQS